MITAGLLAATAAMGQPYGDPRTADNAHPWAPVDPRRNLSQAFDPALLAPAHGPSAWVASGAFGGPFHGAFPVGPAPPAGGGGFNPTPGPLAHPGPGFQPWTPDFPGAPNPLNTRSGGDPGMGFWEVAPTAFRYRRVPVTGGPNIYAHGWYTPWGDFEGVMIIRGNARGLIRGQGH